MPLQSRGMPARIVVSVWRVCVPLALSISKRLVKGYGRCHMSEVLRASLPAIVGMLTKSLPPLSDDGDVIAALVLILTVRHLQSSGELLKTCSLEGWGSPSELRGTAARFRLAYLSTVNQKKTMYELLRALTTTSPRWRKILTERSEDFYYVEDWFWEAINPD